MRKDRTIGFVTSLADNACIKEAAAHYAELHPDIPEFVWRAVFVNFRNTLDGIRRHALLTITAEVIQPGGEVGTRH